VDRTDVYIAHLHRYANASVANSFPSQVTVRQLQWLGNEWNEIRLLLDRVRTRWTSIWGR